jgi:GNAT superfamily N-acetyltransferase
MPAPERLTEIQARAALPQLAALLQDAVAGGASIGFLRPLSLAAAQHYWHDVIREVGQGSRVLLVIRDEAGIAGSVQLGLCQRQNGRHRAEVQKLLVHTRTRRRGLAGILMSALEAEARAAGRTLLYLDTEPAQPAEAMYRKHGWIPAGEIPDYATTPDGHLHSTVIFYKKLIT